MEGLKSLQRIYFLKFNSERRFRGRTYPMDSLEAKNAKANVLNGKHLCKREGGTT